jgi:transcriptional regulator with XRE-family HTH domain
VRGNQKVAQQFGKNLRRCRHRAGFSQEKLGIRSGLHRTEIGLLERGARIPRIDTTIKISRGLGIQPAELLEGITWQPAVPFEQSGSFVFQESEED